MWLIYFVGALAFLLWFAQSFSFLLQILGSDVRKMFCLVDLCRFGNICISASLRISIAEEYHPLVCSLPVRRPAWRTWEVEACRVEEDARNHTKIF